jgi:LPXTG-motif cell wall-anchored protein
VVDPGDQVVDVGPLSTSEREQLESDLDPAAALPATGHDDVGPAALGLAVFLTGVGLTALAGWRRRTST